MSGHSKWSTIKRQKGVTDAKRGALFTKVAREISVAARQGGGDPDANYRLRLAMDKARSVNMPLDNIKRAIEKATGGGEGEQFEEVVYEGYGPGGVALLVETLTDNRNRTAQDVRHAFTRNNGNLGETGSTAWMFSRKGVILIEKADAPDEDRLLELGLEAGADDLGDAEDTWEITTEPSAFRPVRDAFQAEGIPMVTAELTMVPQSTVPVDGAQARAVLNLLEALEELDDVQAVYANFDIPEDVMASR